MPDIGDWLSSFTVELAIAAVFFAVGIAVPRVRKYLDLREFRRAFGNNVGQADDVFFSIPLWSVRERKRSIARFRRTDPGGAIEEFYGPTNTFAREDVLGAVYISEMIARRFKKPISLMSDDHKIATDTWSRRSAIIIGSPMANYHARGIVRTYEQFHAEELYLGFDEIEENDDSGARLELRDLATGDTFRSSEQDDFAFVVRLRNLYGDAEIGYIYLVGGIHAEGTQAAAIYLADCWRAFAKSDGAGAVLLHLQRNQPETVRPVRYFNLPGKPAGTIEVRGAEADIGALRSDRPKRGDG